MSTPSQPVEEGSRVLYVPGAETAFTKQADGTYPWELARKTPKGNVPLTGKQLDLAVQAIKRAVDPAKAREAIVLVKPTTFYPGTVVKANEDGSADLDVQSANGGVMLHLPAVQCDPAGTLPNTFHLAKQED